MRLPFEVRVFLASTVAIVLLFAVLQLTAPATNFHLIKGFEFGCEQALIGFDGVMDRITEWLGLGVANDDHEMDSKGWWRVPSPFIGSMAESSIFVESSNSIHPSRAAAFSPPILSPVGLSGILIPIEDIEPSNNPFGCPPNGTLSLHSNHSVPSNWISLTTRGGCNFSSKVLHSQALGARAIVVGGKSAASSSLITMYSFGAEADSVEIHAVFTSGKSRVDLERLIIEEGETVSLDHGNRKVKGLRIILSQDQTWSWPLLDLLLLLLFLPSVLTCITLIIHRWRIVRERKAQRAPKELVDRLKVVIWGENLDIEKGSSHSASNPTSPTEETALLRPSAPRRPSWWFIPFSPLPTPQGEEETANAEAGPSSPPRLPTSSSRSCSRKKKRRRSFPLPVSCAICLDEFVAGDRRRWTIGYCLSGEFAQLVECRYPDLQIRHRRIPHDVLSRYPYETNKNESRVRVIVIVQRVTGVRVKVTEE
ncbi:hypothetical protein BT69DRAFT_1317342 [Atractiella rhizophila]|nr:hypothetical protein BT69DRAFT_1317342 [Atractiella rhizophila]